MIEVFGGARVVPVLTVGEPSAAVDVAEALLAGGIRVAEVALRSPSAVEAIRRIAAIDGFIVGAGTILDPDDIAVVRDAGARFAVAPGLDPAVVAAAQDAALPFLPGVATPTEIQRALRLGLDRVKVFPAATLGGPRYLELLAGPFPQLRVLPSGGIDLDSLPGYLAVGSVLAVGGSWMVPSGATPDRVAELARRTSEVAR